jgi:hypothetical protein
MAPKTLWHVTPAVNVPSIQYEGIDPRCDEKGKGEVWLVGWQGIEWAIAHVSFKKRVPPWQLACIRVKVAKVKLRHFNRNVWVAKVVIKADEIMSAERVISQYEKQRYGRKYARPR